MIRKILTLLLLLPFCFSYAQSDKISRLIEEGITLHDQGDYQGAIECYQEALGINPKHVLANYEIAYAYDMTGDYKKSLEFGIKALKYSNNKLLEAFIIVGNSYDHDGSPEKAIAIYKKGLKKFPKDNLLHYNLSLTLYNIKRYAEAYNHAEQAILEKTNHLNGHLMINELISYSSKRPVAIFPKYFVLMLTENPDRRKELLNELTDLMNDGVVREKDNEISVHLSTLPNSKDIVSMLTNNIALFGASLESGKPENMEDYINFNNIVFETLSSWYNQNDRIRDPDKAFEEIYYPFFVQLFKDGHSEAFTFSILEKENIPGLKEWKEKNANKILSFMDWIQQ